MNLGNKLTVFQIIASVTVVTKIYTLEKIQESSLLYLSFLIMHVCGIYFIYHKTKDYFREDP